ncbi:SDR family NAD(P)-dependent oxidoreductase [Tardiphaga sp. 367_B4_N1_1]|uniref:SDR family NAD(P)-dependent oxidoreductase n=1 Tax=Tardiphaga sp. 367_B4_N1_1 TaxID=3240777 RepID=UPI003F21FFF2
MRNLMSLEGKTIIVTGAAQGIGRATINLARELGANAIAIDLNGEPLASYDASDPKLMTMIGSVSDESFTTDAVDKVVERFGSIHGLVNNAGITRPAMAEKMTLSQWSSVLDVHLTGAFLWTQAVGRILLRQVKGGEVNGGAIINISSDAGRAGAVGQINYAAAKSGLLGMTMTTAKEWSKFGIRTNSVCFGVVETPMTETIRGEKFRDGILARIPMGRWALPEEVVQPVCFLLSDAASYITGQHLAVNGGFHISV